MWNRRFQVRFRDQGRFCIGAGGNYPQTSALPLNVTGTLFDELKAWTYRCKMERSVAFKTRQNVFPTIRGADAPVRDRAFSQWARPTCKEVSVELQNSSHNHLCHCFCQVVACTSACLSLFHLHVICAVWCKRKMSVCQVTSTSLGLNSTRATRPDRTRSESAFGYPGLWHIWLNFRDLVVLVTVIVIIISIGFYCVKE